MDYTRMKLSDLYFKHCNASYADIEQERQKRVNDFVNKAKLC